MPAHIYACDDHTHITKLIDLTLRKDGFVVETFPDGISIWNRVQTHPPDLIISDCDMPGVSGLELCRQLRSHEPTSEMPLILLTAKAFELPTESLQKSLRITAVVRKPFSPRALRNLVLQSLPAIEQERVRAKRTE